MNIIEAIVLGLVQGLTEFIPVSSSGHLVIVQQLFGMAPDHLFIEFINFGTLLALAIYFRKRIVEICRDVFINRNFILARNILITAVPAGAIGFALSNFIETSPFFSNLLVVTIALAMVGTVMIVADKLPKASPKEHGQHLSPTRAFWIGIVQVLALIPGVSRSGS